VDDNSTEERPQKRRRQLPARFRGADVVSRDKKFRDVLPEPPPALPPPGMEVTVSATDVPSQTQPCSLLPDEQRSPGGNKLVGGVRKVLETTRNSFGLLRRYFAERFPSHDPESELDISRKSNIVDSHADPSTSSYGPYPNKSSFHLGDWYWNRGPQKSQTSFKELVAIVGDIDFQPSDVRSTDWDQINKKLVDGDCDEGEWLDDDCWMTSPVNISVPFHRRLPDPQPRDYTVAKFHHRSLVSVIREKLVNETDSPHFHYEPYELLWQPSEQQDPVRVHGELYTSPAFIDAHNALQESPGEPGCELPRVVVALMFWSDSTHLTNFGNTKLWPLYMYFGNESKYRRGKPSCNLCEHIAYFETVSITLFPGSLF
jgi:Plavaka transposase